MSTDPPNRISNMDYPNPKAFPLLSYVMSRLPSLRPAPLHSDHDIESPHPTQHSSPQPPRLISPMPRLDDPKVIAAMSATVAEIAETRSVLQALGARPDHETVDFARVKLAEIESSEIFSDQLEEIALSPENEAERAEDKRAAVREREKMVYKAIIQLDEMHEAYEKLLRDEEEKLSKIYDKELEVKVKENVKGKEKVFGDEGDEVDEEIVRVLMEGDDIQEVDLEGRKLKMLPEAFGRLSKIVVLNLSSNQLQALPDSIGGLSNLEEFNLSSNSLQSLPDSIGMLNKKLRIVNVSGNKLTALPDSICYCRSLEGLDAGFNNLGYLPTNIGELFNLVKLSVEYNKIRSLPTSIGEMKSLQYLDIRFNELHTIPLTFGKLTNLVTLNLSGNFSDLKELPETFGELMNLEEVDLSNNQIHALPDSFGRLDKLKKLNLEQNPIAIPPVEALNDGIETVKIFMAKRWADRLMEEEKKSRKELQVDNETGWLKRSVSKLGAVVSNVSEYLGSPRSPRDEVLNLQR